LKKIIPLLFILLFVSCVKFPEDTYKKILDVPADFDWKTIEKKTLQITQLSSVLTESGDTVASFLPPGNYDITIGKGSVLNVVQESSSPALTKAPGTVKQRVYFPAKGKYATVMFEDLFPDKGDMDMNDIVFGLNVQFDLDAQARVLAIWFHIQPRGIGSSYKNIGIAANFTNYSNTNPGISYYIYSDENLNISRFFNVDYLSQTVYTAEKNNNASEVIPITGDYRASFADTSELFINVRSVDPAIATTNFSVAVDLLTKNNYYWDFTLFDEPLPNKINIDIFTLINVRSKEVHFKGQKATERFNRQYFVYTMPKTDFSTLDNWVWAIISDKSIRHPLEFVKIFNSYPNFKTWAEGGGATNINWYTPMIIDSLYTKRNFSYIN